jgi:phosphatidylglycerol lysyltransferase
VSDEWLKNSGKQEIIFSQGMFVEKEIKQQTVITVENSEEKIIAFLNIIPDYVKNEGTYDLLRKTADAPNGIMDYILIELFKYFKTKDIRYVNLGFAPLSGMDDPHNFTEKSMKFAYEKIRSFSHYKGQRDYKEKFNPVWYDKFLIYSNDYDLLQVPGVLTKVIKP